MNFKSLCAATVLAVATAGPTTAAPIVLNLDNGGLSFTFYGLDDALPIEQQATSIDVTGVLDTYTGITPSTPSNFFYFFNPRDPTPVTGEFSLAIFTSFQIVSGDAASGTLLGFTLTYVPDPDLAFVMGIAERPLQGIVRETVLRTVPTISITPVAPVPLPAGGLLLLTGLAGVAGLKRRKKRAA